MKMLTLTSSWGRVPGRKGRDLQHEFFGLGMRVGKMHSLIVLGSCTKCKVWWVEVS